MPELLEAFTPLLENEGIPVSHELSQEIQKFTEEIRRSGPFLAFTHGDATIVNAFCLPSGDVRLIDFETGGFRHILLDGSYARLRYLNSVWPREMPLDLQRRVLDAYRAELVFGCPAAAYDTRFNRALIACSAAWTSSMTGFLPRVVERDRQWGHSTYRRRIVAVLDHFVVLSEDVDMVGPLAVACADLSQVLRKQWELGFHHETRDEL